MAEIKSEQTSGPAGQLAVSGPLVWLASGALSGVVTSLVVTAMEWILLEGGPPAAVRRGSDGEYYLLSGFEYYRWVSIVLAENGARAAFSGLLGGALTALVSSRCWGRSAGARKAGLLWALLGVVLASCAAFAEVIVDLSPGTAIDILKKVERFAMAAGVSGIVGAVFGVLLGSFVKLLPPVLAGRPGVPAWLRLVIYLPAAVLFFFLGAGLSSLLFSSLTPMIPRAALHAFAPYGVYLPLVLFTLWFARKYDRRTWGEIGLRFTLRTSRDVLLGCVLTASSLVAVAVYVMLGIISVYRTDDPVLEALAYAIVFGIAAGFSEELVFRGYLLSNLSQLLGFIPAVWLSAVLFWAVHLASEPVDPIRGAELVLFGVFCALAYRATGSLWLPISFHASIDFLAVGIYKNPVYDFPGIYSVESHAPAWLVGVPGRVGLDAVAWFFLLLAGLYGWIYRPALRAEESAGSGNHRLCQ